MPMNGRWDKVPIYAVLMNPMNETPEPATYEFLVDERVQRIDGRVIYPAGASLSVRVGDTSTQDAEVRNWVRAGWRAQDEAAAGSGFDGIAWDTWWETKIVPAAIFVAFPAEDDPDIIGDSHPVRVTERLTRTGGRKTYIVRPRMAHMSLPIPGINIGALEQPPGDPIAPAPMYAKGIPGGVPSLDGDGKIPREQLPDDVGGGLDEAAIAEYLEENLPDVAKSGAYSDLIGRPTIPTALPPTAGSVGPAAMAAGYVAMLEAERLKLGSIPADLAESIAATLAGKASINQSMPILYASGPTTMPPRASVVPPGYVGPVLHDISDYPRSAELDAAVVAGMLERDRLRRRRA